ncbi:MAG TPA: hypothetical protein PLP11_10800, partial [Bacteroidales bacterium]|nr:hypothetical protein [Bacteroidales bacterium]
MRAGLGVNSRLIEKQQRAREAIFPKTIKRFASRRFGLSAYGVGPVLTKHYFVSFSLNGLSGEKHIFVLTFWLLFVSR